MRYYILVNLFSSIKEDIEREKRNYKYSDVSKENNAKSVFGVRKVLLMCWCVINKNTNRLKFQKEIVLSYVSMKGGREIKKSCQ